MAQLDAMQPEPTMWEIMRRIDEIATGQKEIKDSLDNKYVRKDVYASDEETKKGDSERAVARIKILESRHEWMIRLMVSSVVMSLATLVAEYFRIRSH